MHGPVARVLPRVEEGVGSVCVEAAGGGGVGGGGVAVKGEESIGVVGGSRLESTHETSAVDQSAVARQKVLTAKTQTCQKWGLDNSGGTPGMWNAGCNISCPCVFVFLCCLFRFVCVFVAAWGFIDLILSGCCSCGVTGPALCPAHVIYYQETNTNSRRQHKRLSLCSAATLGGDELPAVATRRPGCSCLTRYRSTSHFHRLWQGWQKKTN